VCGPELEPNNFAWLKARKFCEEVAGHKFDSIKVFKNSGDIKTHSFLKFYNN
jgi:hypothetical protein